VLNAAYRALVEQLPAGVMVPVAREELLELLSGAGVVMVGKEPAPPSRVADFSVREVAEQFGRAGSTVRGWCEAGLLPGAYRARGRQWRIPPAAIHAMQETDAMRFRAGQRGGRAECTDAPQAVVSLGGWRRATSPRAGVEASRGGASG
jgi:hypothetical protein